MVSLRHTIEEGGQTLPAKIQYFRPYLGGETAFAPLSFVFCSFGTRAGICGACAVFSELLPALRPWLQLPSLLVLKDKGMSKGTAEEFEEHSVRNR